MVKTLRRKSALGGGGDGGQRWESGEMEASAGRQRRFQWRASSLLGTPQSVECPVSADPAAS